MRRAPQEREGRKLRADGVGELFGRDLSVLKVLEALVDAVQATVHFLNLVAAKDAALEERVEVTLVAVEPFLHEGCICRDAVLVKHGGFAVGEGPTEGGVGEGMNDVDLALAKGDGLWVGLEEDNDITAVGAERLDTELLRAVL